MEGEAGCGARGHHRQGSSRPTSRSRPPPKYPPLPGRFRFAPKRGHESQIFCEATPHALDHPPSRTASPLRLPKQGPPETLARLWVSFLSCPAWPVVWRVPTPSATSFPFVSLPQPRPVQSPTHPPTHTCAHTHTLGPGLRRRRCLRRRRLRPAPASPSSSSASSPLLPASESPPSIPPES